MLITRDVLILTPENLRLSQDSVLRSRWRYKMFSGYLTLSVRIHLSLSMYVWGLHVFMVHIAM